MEPKIVGKEVVEVGIKAEEAEEVEESEIEVELTENTFTLEILLNTRDCVVVWASKSLTMVKFINRSNWYYMIEAST